MKKGEEENEKEPNGDGDKFQGHDPELDDIQTFGEENYEKK